MAGKKGAVHSDKTTYNVNVDEIAQRAADALVVGKFNPRTSLGVVTTEDDAKLFSRITHGIKLEDFNARLSERLGAIADKISLKINEKLEDDAFKTSELAYLYSVMEDKRSTLTGRQQLQGSQVNVQINNYGESTSKEQILDRLFPSKGQTVTVRELSDVI